MKELADVVMTQHMGFVKKVLLEDHNFYDQLEDVPDIVHDICLKCYLQKDIESLETHVVQAWLRTTISRHVVDLYRKRTRLNRSVDVDWAQPSQGWSDRDVAFALEKYLKWKAEQKYKNIRVLDKLEADESRKKIASDLGVSVGTLNKRVQRLSKSAEESIL